MKKVIVLLLVTLLPLLALAQSEEAGFTADRPGASTGVDVLPKGRVQWETGIGLERSKMDGPAATTLTLNTSLLRWGISESAELRLQADYLYSSCEGTHINGFSNVAIGTKVKLYTPSLGEGRGGLVPAVSLLGNVIFPERCLPSFGGGGGDLLPEEWGGQMGLLFQNELTSWCSLGYETDLIWSDAAQPTFFWGACLGFQLNDRLSLMAEEYNYQYSDSHENWVELGAAYMLTPRLQLDLATDLSLNYPKRYFNLSIGVAWQITP